MSKFDLSRRQFVAAFGATAALAGLAALRAVARRGLPGPGWGE